MGHGDDVSWAVLLKNICLNINKRSWKAHGDIWVFASDSLITNQNITMMLLILFIISAILTDDAEDAQNVGSKYHQHVDEGEQNESNGYVTQPGERLGGE